MRQNALWNCKNPNQGKFNRVLCVCSAGLLRSPTIAWVMGNNGYNTRAAGIHDYALIQVDEVLLKWADLIVCANTDIHKIIIRDMEEDRLDKVYNLKIPDQFEYRQPMLIHLIEERLQELKLI